ncbi:hypothetical protein [Halorhabdus salina]|uniref:hypothetical protein n=1 Tax=Halorhabdus salina TaxID=2750670 RepID=UPI0015EEB335|nr:hypothetical protein [Halorhabdus salina]
MSDEDDENSDETPFDAVDASEDDPFDRIDVEDRPDDPFADLADRQDRDRDAEAARFDDFGYEDDRTDSTPADVDHQPDAGDSVEEEPVVERGIDDPFDRFGVDRREADPFEQLGERSEPVDAEQDSEMWETLSRSEAEPETEKQGQRRFAEVSKHSYCEQCDYFSDPPEVACSNEGTDIIEFVDSETVRVADCPIVAEREELADYESE